VAGSVYVYSASPSHSDASSSHFCDKGAYIFAFAVITIGYVSLGLSVLAVCLHCCFNRGNKVANGYSAQHPSPPEGGEG